VLVTDGGNAAAEAGPAGVLTATPPSVPVARVTGAGDTFMAAHIVAERHGADELQALDRALRTAAEYVSGKAD
jgi:fructose-1-phosphate kinase PfkB-like protein